MAECVLTVLTRTRVHARVTGKVSELSFRHKVCQAVKLEPNQAHGKKLLNLFDKDSGR